MSFLVGGSIQSTKEHYVIHTNSLDIQQGVMFMSKIVCMSGRCAQAGLSYRNIWEADSSRFLDFLSHDYRDTLLKETVVDRHVITTNHRRRCAVHKSSTHQMIFSFCRKAL